MNAQQILALMSVIHNSIAASLTLMQRLREQAVSAGATPEQLRSLDLRLSDAITRREAEIEATNALIGEPAAPAAPAPAERRR